MTFDEVIFQDNSHMMNSTTTNISRLISVAYDEQPADVPASPCYSEDTSASTAAISITGRFNNIEYKYHIDPRVLGTGHNGSVRECIDRASGQRYAVKSIRKSDPSVKPGGLAREIILLQEMKHHSIVQLIDVYEDVEYLHIITDLCEGGELFDKIIEKSCNSDEGAPCFAEDKAARILHQILTAVSYMHKRGIVHRDIKPENVLFETTDEDSPVKIIDFGLSRKHFGNRGEQPSPMRTIVGTPYYIAPEVLRRKYDSSCDLWSVGVIAYILLYGYPPFNGATNKEVHDSVRRGRCRFPSADWSGVSREARDFVHRLLQKDARKRMTVKQALDHPWMVKHISNDVVMRDEDRQDNSSVEVVFHASKRDSIICGGIEKRKVRCVCCADISQQ